MKPVDRQAMIVQIVSDEGSAAVDYLSERLEASRETIRRDLTELSFQGLLRKIHGGAERIALKTEGAFGARLREQADEKRAIGGLAASLFNAGDALFIDTGTTTLAFAQALAARPSMTVMTNSVDIAQTLCKGREGHRVFLIGGEYREEGSQNVGPLAVQQIGQFNARDAVITIGGLTASGVMDFELLEAEIARAMIMQAERVTVLADHTKLNRTALFHVCSLQRIDRLVVGVPLDPALARACAAANIAVHVHTRNTDTAPLSRAV